MSGNNNQGPSIREAAHRVLAVIRDAGRDPAVDCTTSAGGYLLGDVMIDAAAALEQALAKPEVSRADILDRAEWAIEGIANMKAGKPVLPIHIQAIVTAAEAGLQAHRSFGVRWDADMRAIERWRSGAPSRDIVKLIETAGAVVAADRKALDELGGMAIQIEPETRALTDRLGAALEDVLSYSIEAAVPEARQMMLPDHADLVVWLMTLLDHQPSPAVYGFAMDELGGTLTQLRALSRDTQDGGLGEHAAALIDKMAAGLIAADRRRFVAEQLAMPEDFPDLVAEVLGAELASSYDCTRAWEAWGVGTMTVDDFEPLSDRVQEIVLALMERIAPASRLPVAGSLASGPGPEAASITEHPDAAGLEKRINDELAAICARHAGETIGIDIGAEVRRIAPGWKFATLSRVGKPPEVRLTSFEPGEGATA